VLEAMGAKDAIEFLRVEQRSRIILPDLDFTFTPNTFVSELTRLFPAETRAIEQFVAEMTALVDEALRTPMSKPLYLMSRLEMMLFGMKVFFRQRRVFKYQSKTTGQVLNGMFTDPLLKTIFYSVVPLKRISMMGVAWMWNDFLSKKLYYPRGGYQVLADTFATAFENSGGTLVLGMGVKRIIVESGQAIGVELDDERRIQAERVISNADIMLTFNDLVSRDHLPKGFIEKLERRKIATSAYYVYLGVDLDASKLDFDRVTVCPFVDMEHLDGHIHDPGNCYFWIEMPTKHYPLLALEGKHIVVLATVASHDDLESWGLEADGRRGASYRAKKERVAEGLICQAERVIPGLSQHILVKEVATPVTIAHYTWNRGGASMGWDQTPEDAMKPGQVTPIRRLYLVGQWTYPQGGVPGVVGSGWILANLIKEGRI
jgi:prolycopene isomerase